MNSLSYGKSNLSYYSFVGLYIYSIFWGILKNPPNFFFSWGETFKKKGVCFSFPRLKFYYDFGV